MSVVLGWILKYQNWSIEADAFAVTMKIKATEKTAYEEYFKISSVTKIYLHYVKLMLT